MDMIRVENRPTKTNRELALVEFAHTVRQATVGLGKITDQEAKNLVTKLGEALNLSSQEQESLLTQLTERISRSQQLLQSRVEAITASAVSDIMTAMREEIASLEKRLSALSQAA